jgi:hypothetical protein
MTRGFVFKLADPTKAYNLWNDLIASTITDLTFANSPYIPDRVSEIQILMPAQGPNSVGNAGNNFGLVDIVNNIEMSNQVSGGLFKVSLSKNLIPLKNLAIKPSAANIQIEVTIVAN